MEVGTHNDILVSPTEPLDPLLIMGPGCSVARQKCKSLTRVLTFGLALRNAPEVVSIPEAAAVIELLALATHSVKEVARHHSPAGARGLFKITRTLVG